MQNQEPIFFTCDNCHTIIEEIIGAEKEFTCCSIPMKRMSANTSEGAREKHLPVVQRKGNKITVEVGSVFHPMSEEHSIEWVCLQTEAGIQRTHLCPAKEPVAVFYIADDDRPIAAYAYCNLHGFWKTEIQTYVDHC